MNIYAELFILIYSYTSAFHIKSKIINIAYAIISSIAISIILAEISPSGDFLTYEGFHSLPNCLTDGFSLWSMPEFLSRFLICTLGVLPICIITLSIRYIFPILVFNNKRFANFRLFHFILNISTLRSFQGILLDSSLRSSLAISLALAVLIVIKFNFHKKRNHHTEESINADATFYLYIALLGMTAIIATTHYLTFISIMFMMSICIMHYILKAALKVKFRFFINLRTFTLLIIPFIALILIMIQFGALIIPIFTNKLNHYVSGSSGGLIYIINPLILVVGHYLILLRKDTISFHKMQPSHGLNWPRRLISNYILLLIVSIIFTSYFSFNRVFSVLSVLSIYFCAFCCALDINFSNKFMNSPSIRSPTYVIAIIGATLVTSCYLLLFYS